MIHPTAIVNPKAQLDSSVEIGAYSIVDADVSLAAGCRVGPHVHLTGHTVIAENNVFHAGCVIGDAPQDLKYRNAPTGLRIGPSNVFREYVTVHRSTTPEEDTIIGSNNFLMVNSHVGHNVVVGNHVILANGSLLAGHVLVQDRAFISGNCLVHQHVRIGTLTMMQGGSAVSKDLPPYTVARGENGICGLNIVGLRRAGLNSEERMELKRLYSRLFRQGGRFQDKLRSAQSEFQRPVSRVLLDFVAASRRGLCSDAGRNSHDAVPEEEA